MKKQIWSETYKVTSFLVNLRGQAGLYAILNLIQDVGWQHATHLEVRPKKNMAWVFTRQKLSMRRWPQWNEMVTIRTWLRPPEVGAFIQRDYEIFIESEKIGQGVGTFTAIDTQTRKLALQDWTEFSAIWRPDGHLAERPGKIALPAEVENLAQFQVRNSDIDLNHHVNNTKYAQWILDAIPIEILRAGTDLQDYEVNFLLETKTGDVITVQKAIQEKVDGPSTLIQFQGIRNGDGKTAFTAQMRVVHDGQQ